MNRCPKRGAAIRYRHKVGMDSYCCRSMFVAGTDELITDRQGWACNEIERLHHEIRVRDRALELMRRAALPPRPYYKLDEPEYWRAKARRVLAWEKAHG